MRTVTTLGATSTVGIFPSGLALGRPETNSDNSNNENNDSNAVSISSPSNTRASLPPSSYREPIHPTPESEDESEPYTSVSLVKGQLPTTQAMRTTTQDQSSAAAPPQTPSKDTNGSSNGLPMPTRSSRGGSEGLSRTKNRRIPSSQYSNDWTSTSSDRAFLRSNTYSIGSARPILNPRSVTSPLPPNKLVKRTYSQQPFASGGPTTTSSNFKQAFRRPATSHQRSATLSNTLPENNTRPATQDIQPPSERGLLKRQYRLVFRVHRSKPAPSNLSARRPVPRDVSVIRRIQPDGTPPILLPANNVLPSASEVDEYGDLDTDNSAVEGSPEIGSSFKDPFGTESHPLGLSDRSTENHEGAKLSTRPKRSFSLSGILQDSSSILSGKDRTKSLPKLLKRKADHRIVSAPVGTSRKHMSSSDAEQSKVQDVDAKDKASSNNGSPGDSSPIYPLSSGRLRHSQPRPGRHSIARSDITSSRVGSEGVPRIFSWVEGEDSDLNSDTVYDSMRTGTTRSSFGHSRPPLDNVFDKNTASIEQRVPRRYTTGNRPPHQSGICAEPNGTSSHNTAHDRDVLMSTHSDIFAPVRYPTFEHNQKPFRDHALDSDVRELAEESAEWGEDNNFFSWDPSTGDVSDTADTSILEDSEPHSTFESTPRENGSKSNPFDWSEQNPLDKIPPSDTPRPRTVHGKKRPDGVIIRSSGRRAPSGLHARSQSVPVFQDLTGRDNEVTRKFGTWDIRGKGVTEDWDEDFDFGEESTEDVNNDPDDGERGRKHNTSSVLVPDKIKQQQNHLLVDIGLLREWGIQIEELKELRMRVATMGLRSDSSFVKVFDQVDAMIDLADQEAQDEGLAGLRSSASPEHQMDGQFDSPQSGNDNASKSHRSPAVKEEMTTHSSQSPSAVGTPTQAKAHEQSEPSTRPRTDSEAVAKSVIETLQHSRNSPRQTASQERRQDKVPFDTATLKHIVPYVRDLTYKVKQILREAEGLYNSPHARRRDPSFSQVFNRPRDESPSAQKEQRIRLARHQHSGAIAEERDVVTQLRMMSVM
ncbi:MAG: hypothetical protein M1831_003030 [Alyxoria varia]|nr:MAG: hypothetical protein M1831_003030 [Alyxoria varia]